MNDHVAPHIPIVFPQNPAVDDVFDAPNGARYRWDGVVWVGVGGGGGLDPNLFVLKAGDTMTGDLLIRDPTGAMLIVDGMPTTNATVRLNAAALAALELNSGADTLLTMRLPNGEEFDLITEGASNSFSLRAGGAPTGIIFEVDHTQQIARFTVPPRTPVDPVDDDDLVRKGYADGGGGYVRKTGDTMTGDLYVGATGWPSYVGISGDLNSAAIELAGDDISSITFTAGSPRMRRWSLGSTPLQNQDMDIQFVRWDGGAIQSVPLRIHRTGGVQIEEELFLHKDGDQTGVTPAIRFADDGGNLAWVYASRSSVVGGPSLVFRTEDADGANTLMRSRPGQPGEGAGHLELMAEPIEDQDAVTKAYVDAADDGFLLKAGDDVNGPLRWTDPPGNAVAIHVTRGGVQLDESDIRSTGRIAANLFDCWQDGGGYFFQRSISGEIEGGLYKRVDDGLVLLQSSGDQRPQIELSDRSERWTILDQRGGQFDGEVTFHKLTADAGAVTGLRWENAAGDTLTRIYSSDLSAGTGGSLVFRTAEPGGANEQTVMRTRPGPAPHLEIVADPVDPLDAANRVYVDQEIDAISTIADDRILRAGDTMQGALRTTVVDPVDDDELVSKGYVDQRVTTSPSVIGAIDAATGECRFAGGTTGPVPEPDSVNVNDYLICEEAGTIPSGPAAGISMVKGDWLISNGSVWFDLNVGSSGVATTADQVALVPEVAGFDNVQTAMEQVERGIPRVWATGASYETGALIIWDRLLFRVNTDIPVAPATPDFRAIELMQGSQSDYWAGQRDNTNALWLFDNWVHIATVPCYGSFRLQLECFGTSIDCSFVFEIATTFNAGTFTIVSQTKNPAGTLWRQFRLSAQGGGANLVRFEGQLGSSTAPNFKISITGLRVDQGPVAQRVALIKPLVASDVNLGGTQYLLMAAYGNGAVQAPRFDVFESGGRFHCHHPEASDANDGDIGARIFGRGLNIVGCRTEAGDPAGSGQRSTQIWGELLINGTSPVIAGEFRCNRDNFGFQTFAGGWFYKRSGAGLALRNSTGNQQPTIENNDGSNRRDIIDTVNGDARYVLRTQGVVSGDRGQAVALWQQFTAHYTIANFAGAGNDPPSLQANSNALQNQNGAFVSPVYLPVAGYVGNGEPFYFRRVSDFAVTINNARTSMTGNWAQAANSTVIFVWNGATNLWDFVAQVPNNQLPAQQKHNSLNNSYTLPHTRGANGQVLRTDANGNVTWQASTFAEFDELVARVQRLEARLGALQ